MNLQPVAPGTTVSLTDAAAAPPPDAPAKDQARVRLEQLGRRMEELQDALYAERTRALLVVLQGRDTSGKDGAIRKVFGRINPQGLELASFKAPTATELAHDFLWRVHKVVPARGAVGVFNRSHYEDVLAVRVHRLVPEGVWRPRYELINQFEHVLPQTATTVLKFFLHFSRAEQRERLLARLEEPEKVWKFSAGDLGERKLWDAYTEAYEEVLARTSTREAPWYVVPADKKYLRDLLIAEVVTQTLERMDPRYPAAPEGLEAFRRELG
jgi:PPK2 family polyphosphate:nucleotide phosphotransferase